MKDEQLVLTYKCSKCGTCKEPHHFYKNLKKKNGLESNCKSCVLKRKSKRYSTSSKIKKKNKRLRSCKRVNVLDVENCTFCEVLINRPQELEGRKTLKEFVKGVLWQASTLL